MWKPRLDIRQIKAGEGEALSEVKEQGMKGQAVGESRRQDEAGLQIFRSSVFTLS